MLVRRHLYYSGHVQGVGFRYAVARLAQGRPVTGTVRNLRDGRVELIAEGPAEAVAAFLADIEDAMGWNIHHVEAVEEAPTGEFAGFRVAGAGG